MLALKVLLATWLVVMVAVGVYALVAWLEDRERQRHREASQRRAAATFDRELEDWLASIRAER